MQQAPTSRLPETTLDWFKTNAFAEHSKMLYTPSVQIALRQHLRLSYWLSKGQAITPESVRRACKLIAFADTPEGAVPVLMGQEHIDAVLSLEQGFAPIVAQETGELTGWCVPEMLGMLEHANEGFLAGAQGRSVRAKKAAEARWTQKPPIDEPRAAASTVASDDF